MLGEQIVIFAKQYLNTPYKWGGQDFRGLDCSGLVVKVLQDIGYLKLSEDYTARGLYKRLKKDREKIDHYSTVRAGSILFFGHTENTISHVAIAINDELMIEAGSGDHTTTTIREAALRDARVKISFINKRKDFYAAINLISL